MKSTSQTTPHYYYCFFLQGWVQTDMGGRNGRKAPVEIVDSVNGITNVLSRSIELQKNKNNQVVSTNSNSKEFDQKFLSNDFIFVGYDFELLPF